MNTTELKKELEAMGVNPRAYYFGHGYPNEAYVLTQEPDGKWVVYVSERGERAGSRYFDLEEEACAHFRDLILSDPSAFRKRR